MAQMIEKETGQVLDELFQAIDVITTKRLEKLHFDKTLRCEIIDNQNAAKGEYLVSNGISKFTAYSDIPTYAVGTPVYVTIPNGDFNQPKLIKGKYLTEDMADYATYVNPMDTYVDITGNLITLKDEVGLVANHPSIKEKILWQVGVFNSQDYQNDYENNNHQLVDEAARYNGYDQIGLQAKFKNKELQNYSPQTGAFGLRLEIVTHNPDDVNTFSTESTIVLLDSKNMLGDPYNFIFWSQQQITYNMTNLFNIIGMRLVFYQDGNFRDVTGELIPHGIATEDQASADLQMYLAFPNIHVKDITLSLGYGLDQFDSDQIFLYSFDSSTYLSSLPALDIASISEAVKNNNKNFDNEKALKLQEYNSKDIFMRWVHIFDDGTIKAVRDLNTDIGTWQNASTVPVSYPSKATIHWYRRADEDGVKDPLAGVFWKEIVENKNKFELRNFQPELKHQNEYIKILIEYPSLDYLEDQFKRDPDYPNLDLNITTLELSIAMDEATLEDDSLSENARQAIEDRLESNKARYEYLKGLHASYISQCTLYESAQLVFTNTNKVVDASTAELVNDYELVCDINGSKGTYYFYDTSGLLRNQLEGSKQRFLSMQFSRFVTGNSELDVAEKVCWYIPKEQSMIQLLEEDSTYEDGKRLDSDNDGGKYYIIERYGTQEKADAAGQTRTIIFNQPFHIRSTYINTFDNNTVKCKVIKNGKEYVKEFIMSFGVANSNGTDYTLVCRWFESKDGGANWREIKFPVFDLSGDRSQERIKCEPHLYDYNNKEITTSSSFTVSLESAYNGGLQVKDGIISTNGNSNNFYHYIVKVTGSNSAIKPGRPQTTQLVEYYPLAIRFAAGYDKLVGSDKIIYSATGSTPSYYQGKYGIVGNNDTQRNVTWKLEIQSGESNNYYPQISSDGYLTVLRMYMSGNKTCSLIASVGQTVVWCQPLYITQDVYSSSFLNNWDGEMVFDEKNNTIMSAMIGAGQKNANNTFDGVLMGDVRKIGNSISPSNIGLFGFNQGELSFGFRIDGTAFIGKSGHGRIEFDGNKGVIKSADFDRATKGMQIDLDDGLIHIKGTNEDAGYPLIIGNNFKVAWDGSINASAGIIGGWFIRGNYLTSSEKANSDGTITTSGVTLFGKDSSGTQKIGIAVGKSITRQTYYEIQRLNKYEKAITCDLILTGDLFDSGNAGGGSSLVSLTEHQYVTFDTTIDSLDMPADIVGNTDRNIYIQNANNTFRGYMFVKDGHTYVVNQVQMNGPLRVNSVEEERETILLDYEHYLNEVDPFNIHYTADEYQPYVTIRENYIDTTQDQTGCYIYNNGKIEAGKIEAGNVTIGKLTVEKNSIFTDKATFKGEVYVRGSTVMKSGKINVVTGATVKTIDGKKYIQTTYRPIYIWCYGIKDTEIKNSLIG